MSDYTYCLDGEVWKDIPEYEGIYQASTFGRIRTVDGKVTHSVRHGVRKWSGRILKFKGVNPKTGNRVSLWKGKTHRDFLVARLIGFTFLGIPEDLRMTINHIDGNRFNNNIENLEWLSLGDNIRHAFETGLMTTQKPVNLIIKGVEIEFRSLSLASRNIGRGSKYISDCLINNRPIKTKDGEIVEVIKR